MLAETVARRCSEKKVFLEILQNSQENTCARVSTRIFPMNLTTFLRTPFLTEHLFWQNTSGGCFFQQSTNLFKKSSATAYYQMFFSFLPEQLILLYFHVSQLSEHTYSSATQITWPIKCSKMKLWKNTDNCSFDEKVTLVISYKRIRLELMSIYYSQYIILYCRLCFFIIPDLLATRSLRKIQRWR